MKTPMKKLIHVVTAHRKRSNHNYVVGVYESLEDACKAVDIEENNRGGKYSAKIKITELNKMPEDLSNNEREQITDAMNAYYNVYSKENIAEAKAAVEAGNKRLIKESILPAPLGEYEQQIHFYKELFDEFGEPVLVIIPSHRDDLSKAVELAKQYWPHAEVTGIVAAFPDVGSGVEVLFDNKYRHYESNN